MPIPQVTGKMPIPQVTGKMPIPQVISFLVASELQPVGAFLAITNYQLPITNYQQS